MKQERQLQKGLHEIKFYVITFIRSKIAVCLILLGVLGIGLSQSSYASSVNYNFATCFQYYMLDNRADSVKNQADNQKIANIAPLGSGGISGTFSYNDIVNSAPNDEAKKAAKKFVSMVATYSTFKYFSNRVQGFESWGAYVGRFLLMIFMLPISLLMDFVTMLVPQLIKLIAKLNVIPLLGQAMTDMTFNSQLIQSLGLSKSQVQGWITALMSFAVGSLVISLWMTLRHGSQNIDKNHLNKFKGRLFTILCLPVVIGGGATLVNEIGDMAGKAPELNATFTRFLVDDRSWAYNYNFAPLGNSYGASDIGSSDRRSGTFVDLSFDPYKKEGKERIEDINKDSAIAGDETVFKNTSLLLAYGMSQAFSATDYINYEGSEDSLHKLGKTATGGNNVTYGSYYSYATSFTPKQLLDVDNAYFPSGGQSGVKDDQNGSYKSAIDDYKADKDQLNSSKTVAWRDRFIYGAKNSGDLDKYYGDTPSQEMVKNQVGGHKNGTVPSDQSMFLILSTIFDETGGRYYIPAPARGIKQTQGQFDSNRSDYYAVSMIGNPFFTVVGMLTEPLITLVVLIALIFAIFSVGLLDMNIRPLAAWIKGLTVGDIEYCEAFLFYSLGIGGTVVMLTVMPTLLVTLMESISTLAVQGIPIANNISPTSAQQSLAFNGTPLVLNGAVSLIFAVAWYKSVKFRNILNEFFCLPWNWAQAAGRRLERSVNTDSNSIKYYGGKANKRGNNRLSSIKSTADKRLKRMSNKILDKPLSPTNSKENPLEQEEVIDSNNLPLSEETPKNMPKLPQKPKDFEDIKRDGKFERIRKKLSQVQTNPNISSSEVEKILNAQDAINHFAQKPNEKNFAIADNRLHQLRHNLITKKAPQEEIAFVDNAIKELNEIGRSYGLDNVPATSDDSIKSSKNVEKENKDDSKLDGLHQSVKSNKKKEGKDPLTNKKRKEKVGTRSNEPQKKSLVSSKPKDSSHSKRMPRKNKGFKPKVNKVTAHSSDNRVNKYKKVKDENKIKDSLHTKRDTKDLNKIKKSNLESHSTLEQNKKTVKKNSINSSKIDTNNSRNSKVEKKNSKTSSLKNRNLQRKNVVRSTANKLNSINRASLEHNFSEKVNRKESNRNIHSQNSSKIFEKSHTITKRRVNNTQTVYDTRLKSIVSSLGSAVNDESISHSLTQLQQSNNTADVKRNIRNLQKSIRTLDKPTKQTINKKNLVNNLYQLQKSKKFGGKQR